MAPGHSGSGALRLPGADPFPSLDERLVTPETREEVLRGRKIVAQPALDPHADRHCELDYIIRANVRPDFIAATDLITRDGQSPPVAKEGFRSADDAPRCQRRRAAQSSSSRWDGTTDDPTVGDARCSAAPLVWR